MNRQLKKLTQDISDNTEQLNSENMHTIGMLAMLDYLNGEKKMRFLKNILLFFAFGVLPLIYIMMSWYWWNNITGRSIQNDYISLVRLNGKIIPNSGLSSLHVNKSLDRAFADKESKGVILLINSPGGTPVQSSEIYNHLLYLKQKYPKKKLVVLGQDIMTSGAYMIAMAADQVFVNSSTVTGSVGVVMSHYNFSGLAKRFGIQKNIITAGKHKVRLDTLIPSTIENRNKFQNMIDSMHRIFINIVKKSRGSRLVSEPSIVFSGDIWTGSKAVKMGLVDGISSLQRVMKSQFNVAHYQDFTTRKSLISSLADSITTSIFHQLQIQLVTKDFIIQQ